MQFTNNSLPRHRNYISPPGARGANSSLSDSNTCTGRGINGARPWYMRGWSQRLHPWPADYSIVLECSSLFFFFSSSDRVLWRACGFLLRRVALGCLMEYGTRSSPVSRRWSTSSTNDRFDALGTAEDIDTPPPPAHTPRPRFRTETICRGCQSPIITRRLFPRGVCHRWMTNVPTTSVITGKGCNQANTWHLRQIQYR